MTRFEHPVHPAPTGFLRKYVFSLDHKVIGKQFFWFAFAFMAIGGTMALLMRWQLAWPYQPVPVVGTVFSSTGAMTPDHYNTFVTLHGSIMVFFAITPLVIGAFGNFLIPLQIGARDMAFPFLNMLSFWVTALGGVLVLASMFVSGLAHGPQAGWTTYPPLASIASETSGVSQDLWILSLACVGVSSIMGAVNYITTIVMFRAPGMSLSRMPLTLWGLFFTAVLNAIYVPVVASGLVMLLMDRNLGTAFFAAGPLAASKGLASGGQVLLYQHVFWVFGHPEVYILILPAWGMIADMLAIFSRKPAFGYRTTVLAMAGISALSTLVWGHHMFISGMNPYLGRVFTMTTFLVSIPSSVLFLNWLGTLWGGAIRYTTPMLWSLGLVFVFSLGGLTGLFNATQSIDIYIHDSYFVVGHFHLTMAVSVLFAGFAATYYWFPKMFGRMMCERIGRVHFLITLIGLTYVFVMMFQLGTAGHMRRIAAPDTYQFLAPWQGTNVRITQAVIAIFAAQFLFLWNLVSSLFRGEPASANPWEASTLEWTTASPPPPHNFDVIPVVRTGPFEYSHPSLGDRDWIPQTEALPQKAGG